MAVSNLGNLGLEDPGKLGGHHDGPDGKGQLTTVDKFSPSSDYVMDQYAHVSLEEFIYYARLQRADEERRAAVERGEVPPSDASNSSSSDIHDAEKGGVDVRPSAHSTSNHAKQHEGLSSLDVDKLNARNAIRLAKWQFCFALIVTDILGPFNAPYAVSQLGLVPGNLLYVFLGIAAWIASMILWRLFLSLDSARYPLKTFGDLGERIFGTWARYVIVLLQSLQLIVNVGLICLSSGQSLSQLQDGNKYMFCFTAGVFMWALLGMIVAQVRTLKNFGYFSVAAVVMNITIIIASAAAIGKSGPNLEAAAAAYNLTPPFAPVMTAAHSTLPIQAAVNGAMNIVFAYGGAMIFLEILSEMRRPFDFVKSLLTAEILLIGLYILYANVVYGYSGQYTMAVSYQGVGSAKVQKLCNILGIVSGMVAAALYGNIGLKVLYIEIVERWAKGPQLMSKKGTMLWIPISILYWGLAYVLASAVPQVGTISGLIAAICILQFSYTFPFGMALAWLIQRDAMAGEPGFNPTTKTVERFDTWRDMSRWRRGLLTGTISINPFAKPETADTATGADESSALASRLAGIRIPSWPVKIFLLGCTLASLAAAALGMFGSGTSIKDAFDAGGAAATSFGCAAPA